jgi:drug/metabolite transporter (DMT)-like permease
MVKLEHVALLIYIVGSTSGVILLKFFFNSIQYENLSDLLSKTLNVFFITGAALYIFSFLTWLYVLSKMNLNIAYPVSVTLSFLSIILVSTFFLREKFSWNIAIGALLCLFGIYVIISGDTA